jgi:hypothetical protein
VNPEELGRLMEQAQAVQSKLVSLQQELALRRFEGSSGGGMVTAVVTGALRVHELRIEASLLERGDLEMLQDLTAAALNAALDYAQSTVQAELQRASAAMQIPLQPNGS